MCDPRYQIPLFKDSTIEARSVKLQGNWPIGPSAEMNFYPNPTSDELFFNINGITEESFELRISDMVSNTIISEKFNVEDNKANGELDLKNLSPGIYVISIKTNTQSGSKLFIKI